MDPTKTTTGATDAGTMNLPGAGDLAGGANAAGVAGSATGVADTSASATTGALDFTGGSANGNLSMSDSLASAQDNLTSAGMAAKDTINPALGLDQIGSPQASMERPDEPLIPAAPVPGSIGSVTSGPAMTEAPAVAGAMAPTDGTMAGGMAMGVAGTEAAAPASAPYNPFAAPAAQAGQAPADAMNAAAGTAPQTAQPDMNQASSTNVPTALQPKTSKFSKFSMKGGGSSKLTWILGIAAGIFAVAMIVFIVLWIQEMNTQKVVYVPNTPVQPEPEQTSATCVMERAATAEDGMEGLVGINSTVSLNFEDDKLVDYDVLSRYTFGDAAQAENSRPLFATMAALFSAVGAGNEGGSPLSASFDIADNTVDLDMKTDVTSALETEGVTLDLPVDEATGEYLLDSATTKDYLAGQGYVCE